MAVAVQSFSLLVQAQGRGIGRASVTEARGRRKAGQQQEQQ